MKNIHGFITITDRKGHDVVIAVDHISAMYEANLHDCTKDDIEIRTYTMIILDFEIYFNHQKYVETFESMADIQNKIAAAQQ